MNALRHCAGPLAVLLLALGAGTAQASLFSDDEARAGVTELRARIESTQRALDARLATLETTVKSQGLVELLTTVEGLREDMAKMRGQIEVMANDLESAQKRQRDLYVDLDARMRRLEGGGNTPDAARLPTDTVPVAPNLPTVVPPSATPPVQPAAPPVRGDASSEQRSYESALDQFKAGNYGSAIVGFQTFLKAYPRSALAASAQYWVGNAYYAQRNFKEAIASQRTLVNNYPESQKVPDALLNIASSQLELGDAGGARKTLDNLIAKYPQSEAADKARNRLAGR